MTTASPEVETPVESLEDLDEDWEIPCDILGLQQQYGSHGFPRCQGDPAVWVAWRPKCCDRGPNYRLVCDHCRKVYLAWTARQAHIVCPACGADTGGFCDFTPLRKS